MLGLRLNHVNKRGHWSSTDWSLNKISQHFHVDLIKWKHFRVTRPLWAESRVGVKYFSKYLSQVQVRFQICKYKYKFKYSEYLKNIKYVKYFFNQVQVKYKYFDNKQ